MAHREALRSETAEVVRRGQAGKGQGLDCGIEAGKASRDCPANWAISPFALVSQISRCAQPRVMRAWAGPECQPGGGLCGRCRRPVGADEWAISGASHP